MTYIPHIDHTWPVLQQSEATPPPSNVSSSPTPLQHPDYFNTSSMTSIGELFDARVHLGHKRGMWNPLMKPYIYGTRVNTHIIDLDITLRHLTLALNVIGHMAYRNGIILFVNERTQFDRLVQQTARDCGEYFVTPRWRPGTLTNSQMLLGTMHLPDLIIFLSTPPSKTAITEAAMCNIPTVAVVDTDSNPNLITYPVPGNDDSPSAVRLYCRLFSEVIRRAKTAINTQDIDETTLRDSVNSFTEPPPVVNNNIL